MDQEKIRTIISRLFPSISFQTRNYLVEKIFQNKELLDEVCSDYLNCRYVDLNELIDKIEPSLEKEFAEKLRIVNQKFEDQIKIIEKEIQQLIRISEEAGIPFNTRYSKYTQSYTPYSFYENLGKDQELILAKLEALDIEVRDRYNPGWSSSEICY